MGAAHRLLRPGLCDVVITGGAEAAITRSGTTGIMAITPDSAVLLQCYTRPVDESELADQATSILETLRTYLDASTAPVVGVGGVQGSLAEARSSYDEALVAARAARRMPHPENMASYETLGELAVLLRLPDAALNESLLAQAMAEAFERAAQGHLRLAWWLRRRTQLHDADHDVRGVGKQSLGEKPLARRDAGEVDAVRARMASSAGVQPFFRCSGAIRPRQ
ncbi:hypothetical protein GCM10010360_40310 [Streptomyces nogalater]